MPELKTHIKAHDKSVVVDGTVLWPLTSPEAVAAQLRAIVARIEDREYAAGQRNVQEAMRLAIGVK